MKNILLIILSAFISFFTCAQQDDHSHSGSAIHVDNEAFNSIKNLVGEWQGGFKWSGGRTTEGQMNARYYLTGNGTAVVEDLMNQGNIIMTSVYHLDGTELRVTHYCAAGNQPRLKASAFNSENKSVNFQLVDITNLTGPDAAHVKGIELRFTNIDKVTILFTFTMSGIDSIEQIDLNRSK
ncbi:MAG TPA: hypothetical protein VGZ90_04425 [Puia sp.]|jgi:hypothetical protein|nr:hypothetical protein [Puia sp.]